MSPFRYARASEIALGASGQVVYLSAAEPPEPPEEQGLFTGSTEHAFELRLLLLTLQATLVTRFWRTDFVQRILDPVVSVGPGHVRLEVFSACGSAYCCVDLTEAMFESAQFGGLGTTNVDFGSAFLEKLGGLRRGLTTSLEVGWSSLELTTPSGPVLEKKVRLPERWVRGFLEIQTALRSAIQIAELTRPAARQLISAIPSSGPCQSLWLTPDGDAPKVLPTPSSASSEVGGAPRLSLLRSLLPYIERLGVYRSEGGVTGWVADLRFARLTLALSRTPRAASRVKVTHCRTRRENRPIGSSSGSAPEQPHGSRSFEGRTSGEWSPPSLLRSRECSTSWGPLE
ncbi:MAG: hypothetical protein HY791_16345 [Deltaproteobacteria bacterium]|nr:hypothetical protein [Deltaproteobacteria bacterium]